MLIVVRDEIESLRVRRDKFDAARDDLMADIYAAFERGESNARIARSVDWSREYIGKLRKAWESGAEAPPS